MAVDESTFFVVGASPSFRISALVGEAAQCHAEFEASDVLKHETDAKGRAVPRLVAPGTFSGTCGGRPLDRVLYSVEPASVEVEIVATHISLEPFTLDSAHPDHTIGLLAVPSDRCGRRLNAGTTPGNARWTFSPSCAEVVRRELDEGETAEGPSDNVRVGPLAPGTCTLHTRYGEAETSVELTVR